MAEIRVPIRNQHSEKVGCRYRLEPLVLDPCKTTLEVLGYRTQAGADGT
jgi:hypothetical protein